MLDLKLGDNKVLLKQLDDESIDLVVTSPPYDNLRTYDNTMDCWGWDDFVVVANELKRVLKPGGVIIWVVGDATMNGSETGTSFKQALYFKEIGFNLHDTMIYHKENYVPLTHNRYEQCFEYMFVISKGRPKTFNPIKVKCKNAGKIESYGDRRRTQLDKNQAMRAPKGIFYLPTKETKIHPNIFSYTCGGSKSGHPAAFPDELARDMIESWSNEGDVVLDPFMGSGTTGKFAVAMGRSFIGMEIVERYYEIAKSRIGNSNVLW